MIARRDEANAAPMVLVAVGPRASKADSSWLALDAETRVPGRWPARAPNGFLLKEKPFLRLVIVDEIEDSLIECLEARQKEEAGSLLVVVSNTTSFSKTGPASQRLNAPVLMLGPGATFEDAIRVWFNPLLVRGMTGFDPRDMRALAGRPAVGWVARIQDRDADDFARFSIAPASAWLLQVATNNVADVDHLVRGLQEATQDANADMLFFATSSGAGGVRGSLATLITLSPGRDFVAGRARKAGDPPPQTG
jgi:hypothetical protein